MKKIFSLIMLSLSLSLAVFLFVPKSVLADGMMVRNDPFSDRWDYADESNQQAFINYENGLQKMIISVGLDDENINNIVWLFPVPTEPSKVSIDVLSDVPKLNGQEISKKAKSNLNTIKNFLFATQFYTIPYAVKAKFDPEKNMRKGSYALGSSGFGDNIKPDVTVYEHLEKEGMISEIVTAKTANGLYEYLKGKGLKIEFGSILVLNNYFGKDYSFVVSWLNSSSAAITEQEIAKILYQVERFQDRDSFPKVFELMDSLHQKYLDFDPINIDYKNVQPEYLQSETGRAIQQEIIQLVRNDSALSIEAKRMSRVWYRENGTKYVFRSNQKGVLVSFPTKDMYFPLIPTSVYGDKVVPATIRVIGHVSPKVFHTIENFTKTEYFIDSQTELSDDFKSFFSGNNHDVKYTKIEINAPSKLFIDDLWIKTQAPFKTYYLTFIVEHSIFGFVIFLVLSSVMAGILAGMLVFKDLRKKPVNLVLFGLSNVLTILGLLIVTILIGTKSKSEAVKSLLVEIKQKGYFWKRRVAVITFFLDVPFLVLGFLFFQSLNLSMRYPSRYLSYDNIVFILVFDVLPIMVLVLSFRIKRIKPEDKKLFEQLKLSGYSSWSFHPKDKLKFAFVPLFSVSFLIISWLLVKLVLLAV